MWYIIRLLQLIFVSSQRMLYETIFEYLWLQCALIPIFIYLIIRKHYLDDNQLRLLVIGCIWICIYFMGGWVMQILRIIIMEIYSLVLLQTAVIQVSEVEKVEKRSSIRLAESQNKKISYKVWLISKYYKSILKLKLDESFVIPLTCTLWLVIKIYFSQAYKFGIGLELYDHTIFQGFLETFYGWNCTYTQYTFFPTLSLCIVLLSRFVLKAYHEYRSVMTQVSNYSESSYSYFFLKYMINPSLVLILIESLYNLVAHIESKGMLDCYYFLKYGVYIQAFYHIGIPLIIVHFFYRKSGQYSVILNSTSSSISEDDIKSPKRLLDGNQKEDHLEFQMHEISKQLLN